MTANLTKINAELAATKPGLHPRNQHRGRYDFDQLIKTSPQLGRFVQLNLYEDASINFADPKAVKALNRALLQHHYAIANWDIPAQYLCPPIPGRADYVHHVADLLANANDGVMPAGENIRVLDIGTGANVIYPLIGQHEYGWQFVGADIDPVALHNAHAIIERNPGLSAKIELRLQSSAGAIFIGVLQHDETFDLTMCNPPFHASLAEAQAGSQRKWQNLGKSRSHNPKATLNFGGQAAELYCAGGEAAFIGSMVSESAAIAHQCFWFTTLVSKASSLPAVYRALKKVGALQVKTIAMAQGQKQSRIVAWTFLDAKQQQAWRNYQR
jgi:23S rRNA (adenine1618-N6)-methyltransferase